MKRKLSLLLICAMVIGSALLVTACGDKPTEASGDDAINIMITINYPKKANKPTIQDFKFRVEKGSTVLQATELYGSLAEIPVMINTTTNEVTSINDVDNEELIKKAHWKFTVNKSDKGQDAASVKLSNGDSIEWEYIK